MQDEPLLIGVDVAKDELVVGVAGQSAIAVVGNSAVPIRRWLKSIPSGALIAMESTGRYHALLAQLAHEAGFTVFVLNAKDVWYFARGEGRRGKTDRLDAHVIANYLHDRLKRLHPWCPGSEQQRRIDDLLRRRATVVLHQAAIRKSLEGIKGMTRQATSIDKRIDSVLAAMDDEVQKLIASDARLLAGQQLILTVPGFGPQGAAMAITLLERIAFKTVNGFVAYSGLDPRPADSGNTRGRRHLTKRGPPILRRQAFLAAFSASRTKVFKPIYRALRARGFSTTEAFVILGRKLLRIVWSVWKSGQPFDPAKVAQMA